MKILMLSEYFTPYDFGGSEWSTFYLAKGLSKLGHKIIILTPKYGNIPTREKTDNFTIIRFPFYKKIKSKKQLSPFWQSNIPWMLWTSFFTAKYCLKEKIDIIHVQGKYFMPAAIISKLILRKKVIVTLRDYIVLCPLGMCLLKDQKVCGIFQYFTHDLPIFLSAYHQDKNILLKSFVVLSSIRARIVSYVLKSFLMFADVKVVLSKVQKNIYERAGIKKIQVIGNPFEIKIRESYVKKNQVIYAGRLTPGKGVDLMVEAIPEVLKQYPKLTFCFYGEGFLKSYLAKRAKKLGVSSMIKFPGYIAHQKLLVEIKKSQLAIIPSVWPEPFGRIVVESLIVKTPVVVSNNAGVSESIKDGLWGKIVNLNAQELADSINWAMANIKKLQKKINNDHKEIKEKFSDKIYDSYAKIYRSLV